MTQHQSQPQERFPFSKITSPIFPVNSFWSKIITIPIQDTKCQKYCQCDEEYSPTKTPENDYFIDNEYGIPIPSNIIEELLATTSDKKQKGKVSISNISVPNILHSNNKGNENKVNHEKDDSNYWEKKPNSISTPERNVNQIKLFSTAHLIDVFDIESIMSQQSDLNGEAQIPGNTNSNNKDYQKLNEEWCVLVKKLTREKEEYRRKAEYLEREVDELNMIISELGNELEDTLNKDSKLSYNTFISGSTQATLSRENSNCASLGQIELNNNNNNKNNNNYIKLKHPLIQVKESNLPAKKQIKRKSKQISDELYWINNKESNQTQISCYFKSEKS